MEAGGRMMSVGLHPHMSVRPGRIAGLEQVLDHVARAGGEAWVARRRDIAAHWVARFG